MSTSCLTAPATRATAKRAAVLPHSAYLTVRAVRALLRQPAYAVMTLAQPMIWLLLFGELFSSVAILLAQRMERLFRGAIGLPEPRRQIARAGDWRLLVRVRCGRHRARTQAAR